ncbi:MAG: hypothetical protein ACI9GW_003493 [Halieaceae bacterium]|jgi:hypothetical protein
MGSQNPPSARNVDKIDRLLPALLILIALANCGGGHNDPMMETNQSTIQGASAGDTVIQPVETVETRFALGAAAAWDFQAKNRDGFPDHRPVTIDCDRDEGWRVEDDTMEIRTDSCNYLSLTQESLINIPAGNRIEFSLSHGDLVYRESTSAHVALSIAGIVVWDREIDIPSESAIIREDLVLGFDIAQRDSIEFHLHNHGSNAWTLHSIDAILTGDIAPDEFCPTYDSTFSAIQATVFEQADCNNSLCHSSDSAAGGLDLSTDFAYDNLVDVDSVSSNLLRVNPRRPSASFLYQKLSAKTFPGSYEVVGSPMPVSGESISAGQLEALRLWIEAGAPKDGSVGDTLGRGEDEIEELLGVCLPEPRAINVLPLDPPNVEEGVQYEMPAHEVLAEEEKELCFAVYEDFRDKIPPQYMDGSQSIFYVNDEDVREDPFTHHNVLFYSGVPDDQIHDPSFGEWTCAGGEDQGMSCEPTDLQSCGAGKCRSEVENSIACQGYGPVSGRVNPITGVNRFSVFSPNYGPGFYDEIPTRGIFYWNSHAFNLTTDDAQHHVWRNLFFADDRRFKAERITISTFIYAGAGTPPFTRQEVCREYVLNQDDALTAISSHTHKRGELFTIAVKGSDPFYSTTNYDEPPYMKFSPPWEFSSDKVEDRTLVYCATYNNGLNDDGSLNVETVTRKSRKPSRSSCTPSHCAEGVPGKSCDPDDHASCDSSPGVGDGMCDACPISAGITSDDEMFILLGAKVANFAGLLTDTGAMLSINRPLPGQLFAAGETLKLALDVRNFTLVEPDTEHPHQDDGGSHSEIAQGLYYIYLDGEDDDDPHLIQWHTITDYTLPADIDLGVHTLRVSLRAADGHAIGVEASVSITVQ